MTVTGSLQTKKTMYYAVINLYDVDGRRKQKWVSTGVSALGNNKREANKILRQIIEKYERGGIIGADSILFSEQIKKWHKHIKSEVDIITWQGYKSYIEVHILPYFEPKKFKLDAVTAKHIETYYNEKLKDGRADGKGGLSPNTIKKHAVVLHGALKLALSDNLIPYNPADRARLPRAENRSIGKFYTIEQGRQLLELVKGTPIESVVILTLHYGFRRSEVCGLKWSAVNLNADTISVEHTVVKFSGRIEKDKAKNKASRRTLPLLPNIREYLLELQKQQNQDKLCFGDCYRDTEYICRWLDGRPLEPDYITRKFGRILLNSDLPVIRFHDLRHTTASMLLSLGYSIKDIGDWLGHSDYSTTANIYAHLDLSRKKDIANKLSDTLKHGEQER